MEGPAGGCREVADRVLQRHRYRAAAFASLPYSDVRGQRTDVRSSGIGIWRSPAGRPRLFCHLTSVIWHLAPGL